MSMQAYEQVMAITEYKNIFKLEFGVSSRTHTWPSPFVKNQGRSMYFNFTIMKKGEVITKQKY